MGKVLINFSDDWADEMNIDGWVIMEEEEWKEIKKKVAAKKGYISVGFGTNEDNEYSNGKDFLNTLEVTKLSDDEYSVLNKIFGESYGNTGFTGVWEYDYDEDNEDEDE